jgi:hypothetical protein
VDFKRGLEMWAVGAGRRRAAHGGQSVGGFGLATRGWCPSGSGPKPVDVRDVQAAVVGEERKNGG